MKAHRCHVSAFTIFTTGILLLSSDVIASTSSASYDCIPSESGNGYCDPDNNTEVCGYDGGDCCACTCVSTEEYYCGGNGYSCVDPSAPCVDDDDFTAAPSTTFSTTDITTNSLGCIPGYLADGYCDYSNNNEDCGYDSGDCCQCSCETTPEYSCGVNGFACVDPSASCVDDDDVTTVPSTTDSTTELTINSLGCIPGYLGDGYCDPSNNDEDCGYDSGDCCQCTCESTPEYSCGVAGFACVDPSASCVDDDDFVTFPFTDDIFGSYSFSECITDYIGDGDCDVDNNNDGCEYDGGDCCQCTCVDTAFFTCGQNGFDCVDPSAWCSGGLVEAGTFTTIVPTASAFDKRPGAEGNDIGCGEDGCAPSLARDGDVSNAESRWSCAKIIVPERGQCELSFTFESPQNIKALEVAFWKHNKRERTLKVTINGERIGELPSDSESAFTSLGIEIDDVETVTLESIGIAEDDWISILEVRFMVDP